MATATATHNLPRTLRPEGDWHHAFSYHPMDVEIARAEGVHIYDRDGNRYFDVSGGPMAVNLPHNHPRMKRAIAEQLEHYTYTHPSIADPKRAEFCRLLAEITPADLDHAFLVSGGSEAVETAIKLARQAQIALGNRDKYKIVSHRDSYHGMTLGTLGAIAQPRRPVGLRADAAKVAARPAVLGLRPAGRHEPRRMGRRVREGAGVRDPLRRPEDRRRVPGDAPRLRRGLRLRPAGQLLAHDPRDLRPIRRAVYRRRSRHGVRAHRQVVRHGTLQRRRRTS